MGYYSLKWVTRSQVFIMQEFKNTKKNWQLGLGDNSQKCAFLRDKKVISLILSGNPNLFLDLKQYHSLEHAATKKYIFLVRYLF